MGSARSSATRMRLTYEEIRTRRLFLRRPRETDAALVFESFGADPEVTRFLAWRPHESVADAEAALATRIDRLVRGIEYSWIIELSSAREVAGILSVWPGDDAVELGFVLARAHWNRGLMTEAALAVKTWALGSPGVERIFATCDLENHAPARVLEKAAFTCRGPFEREIVRPNLGPAPRPSLLYEASRQAADAARRRDES